jgi:hypothetical protein
LFNFSGGKLEIGDAIIWNDDHINNDPKIGIILDKYEDIYDTELTWLYVQWPNKTSYVYSGMIDVISSVSE